MNRMKSRALFLVVMSILTFSRLYSQNAKPMAAFRYGIEWHFFNTENKLMFPVNPNISPRMVDAYFYGWCKVGLPDVENGEIVVNDGIINEKGIRIPLKGLKNNWIISGVSRAVNENILFLANYELGNFASMNSKGIVVPNQPLYYWNEIGEGIGAGYGKLHKNPDEAALQEFPEIGTETDYEVWDIINGKILFKIKGLPTACNEGMISVKQGDLWGFTDKKGKWIVKPQFEEIGSMLSGNAEEVEVRSFRSGTVAVKKSGKWGLIDKKGNWILKADYTDVNYAGDGLWTFQQEDEDWIAADVSGKLSMLSKGAAIVAENGIVNYVSESFGYKIKSLKQGWELEFDNAPLSLGNGNFMVLNGEKNQLYSKQGKLLTTIDEEIVEYGKYSNGLLALALNINAETAIGFLDENGNWAIKPGIVQADKSGELPSAMDGFIHVFTGDAHIFYDHKGKLIRTEKMDGNWDMMTVLQDNNSGFWAPK